VLFVDKVLHEGSSINDVTALGWESGKDFVRIVYKFHQKRVYEWYNFFSK